MGDADSELEFFDAAGCRLIDPFAPGLSAPTSTPVQQMHEDGMNVTQGGSPEDADVARIIALIGGRGAWHLDAVCETLGMTPGVAGAVLMTLELAGAVRRDATGRYTAMPRQLVANRLPAAHLSDDGSRRFSASSSTGC